MSNRRGPSKIAVFFAGLGIGAIVALLLAPRTGEETRELIEQKTRAGKEYLESKSKELRRQAQDAVEKGKRTAEDLVDRGRSFVAKASS